MFRFQSHLHARGRKARVVPDHTQEGWGKQSSLSQAITTALFAVIEVAAGETNSTCADPYRH